ncbi:MAG: transposase [Erysipelotrichaceae bacterium]|nr:transposase [Erysipelotrichaceae bacterium]
MSKLTREQKIQIYKKRKASKSLQNLSKEYHIRKDNIRYLIRLIDRHGNQVLRKDKNKDYSLSLKEEMTNKVLLENYSIKSTAIKYGLSSASMFHNWIKFYKENGCVIIERKQGMPPIMKINQSKKKYEEKRKMHIMKNVYYILKRRTNT